MNQEVFPLSALVGLDDLVRALVLAAVEPAIGGVLLRGDKGSAKTTAARGLASLLPDAPFVEIPLGASEDRVVGSVDVGAILADGAHRFSPGLLAAADGGILYVDEVNLLADHLVDVLLDAAATGAHRVERDGFSHVQASRFVLVGSMNPEEGELRPQLLDRFGLSVRVRAPEDPAVRAEALRRRLAFDADPAAFASEWARAEAELAARLRDVRPAPLSPGLEEAVAALCVAAGAEGLRADLVICRAAAALAGWRGLPEASEDEVEAVAPLALGHRRRTPFGQSPEEAGDLGRVVSEALHPPAPPRPEEPAAGGRSGGTGDPRVERAAPGSGPGPGPTEGGSPGPGEETPRRHEPVEGEVPELRGLLDPASRGAGARAGRRRDRGARTEGRGRVVGVEPRGAASGPVSVPASLRATAVRTSGALPLRIEEEDLRSARREHRGEHVVILALDASGSMGADERVAAARAAVLTLVADAYQRRDRVALLTYRGEEATVVLRPTSSTEVALARLGEVHTGGRTPLAAGIDRARALAMDERRHGGHPVVVLVTDGRATWAPGGADPLEAALEAARACRVAGLDALVVDCESSVRPLGAARAVAGAMGARYAALGALGGAEGGSALAEVIGRTLR